MPSTKSHISFLLTLLAIVWGVLIAANTLRAQWSSPTANPPGNNPASFLTTGINPESKSGVLTLTNNFYVIGSGLVGKVGIGTSTIESSSRLVVEPYTNASIDAGAGSIRTGWQAANDNDVINRAYLTSTLSASLDPIKYWILSGSNLYASSTAYNVAIGTTTAGTAKLAVIGGNVGIGTTAPMYELDVNGFTNTKSIYEVSSHGLVGAWSLNKKNSLGSAGSEKILDSSGENNHGINTNALFTADMNNVLDGAMIFDGDADRINVGTDSSLNITGAITIEAWVKPTSYSQHYPIFVRKGDNYRLGLQGVGDGRVYFRLILNGVTQSKSSSSVVPIGTWTHVVGTYDGSYMRIYINGEISGTPLAVNGLIDITANPLIIGAYNAAGTYTFDGSIANVRLYNRSLSQNEIKQSYLQKAQVSDSYVSQRDVIVDATGNVGIGTTTPSSRLFVRGLGSALTTSALNIQNSSGVSSLFVRDDGYIGVGTTSPTVSFYVNGYAIANTPTDSKHLATKGYVDTAAQSLWINSGNFLYASSTNWRVGIGTTSPASALHIYPQTGIEGLRIVSSDFSPLVIRKTDNSDDLFRVNQSGDVTAVTSSATRMRSNNYCDASGNNCFDPSSGWSTEITTIFLTSTTINGNFVFNGGFVGYDAGNKICNSQQAGSHFCRTDEIMYLIQKNGASSFNSINGQDAWIADGPPGFTGAVAADDCSGWTNGTTSYLGHFWIFNSSGGGKGALINCATTKKIACCK